MTRDSNRGLLRSHDTTVSTIQRLADAFWIGVSYFIAETVQPHLSAWLDRTTFSPSAWTDQDAAAVATAIVAFFVMAEANGLYRSWRGAPVWREAGAVVTTFLTAAPVLLFVAFLSKTTADFSRVTSVVWLVLGPTCLVSWRIGVRSVLNRMRKQGRNTRNVAIAGCTEIATKVADRITSDPYSGMNLLGFYDDRRSDRRIASLKEGQGEVVGNLTELVEEARQGKIDIIYIGLPLKAEERINSLLRRLADTTVTVYVVADFFVFDLLHAQWSSVGDIPLVSIFDTPFDGLGGWIKRVEDLVLGSMIMVLISVPMLIIALLIKLTSRGPVFFRQTRYGLNGRPIKVLKFRTMKVLEDGPEVKQATRDDPRVTKIGAVLRRTSLDELPQFLQVLSGEMSIVGPRPHAVAHNEQYRSQIHRYMLRHKVKPGITGWAQVNGWRGETDALEKMEKRIEHDLEYIHNWNLFLDLRIIWLTIFGSRTSRNAY